MGIVNPDSKIYRLGSYQGPVPGEEDTRLNVWYFAAKGPEERLKWKPIWHDSTDKTLVLSWTKPALDSRRTLGQCGGPGVKLQKGEYQQAVGFSPVGR